MSFYVTLASSVDYPGNKQNDFTTILSEPIDLSGQYEVALAQMFYSPLIFTDIGSIEIQKTLDSPSFATINNIKFNIKIPNGTRMEAFNYNWYTSNLGFKAKLELQTKVTTAGFLAANKVQLLIAQIGMWFVYFSSSWDPVKIAMHTKLVEIVGSNEIKYDSIFKCVKMTLVGFKKLQDDGKDFFDLEVINCPTEHIYQANKLYVLENLSDDIINNYYNPEVNDPVRVNFTYDPITHQGHISSQLLEIIKLKRNHCKDFHKIKR